MERNAKHFRVPKMEPLSEESEVLLVTKDEKYTLMAPTRGTVRVVAMGVPGLAEALFEVELRAGRYEVVSLTAKPPPGEALDVEELRSAKRLAGWVRAAFASAIWVVDSDGSVYDSEHQMPEDRDPLIEVMQHYTVAKAFGDDPVVAVAEHLKIGRDAAAQRVYRARQKGYLNPASRKGKA